MYIFGGAMYAFRGSMYGFLSAMYAFRSAMYEFGGCNYVFGGTKYIFGGATYAFGGATTVFRGSRLVFPATDPLDRSMSTRKSSAAPVLSLKNTLRGIGSIVRWKMLTVLASGKATEIGKLAAAGGCSAESASKHMRALREAGVVVLGPGRLYSLAPSVQVNPEKREVDFGFLLARFDHPEQGS